ncbi:MAG: FAD-dependent oxidoreductase [Deltaproteobacteria bacterium]|nr:FAD-dependent oxidoreductase [Deltaproteobacteria bacterium]MBW1962076.1 FAD-dependent oxidoreductase [Deltaproteobacteria bacterium]MBW1993784.1 FAD-dependent oxidoreductase [Deltaproteobacteria bacterium]MBW2151562.1 FAD-dependent oxidoreductase [Deltaproteobacteria bacterium]
MSEPKITVYGAHWCPDCRQSKQFLGEHQIPYRWVDIEEDKNAETFVIKTNNGKRIIPTITFEDGSYLVEPNNAQLAEKLGLKTSASRSHYDLIILGGGPAGLTASFYAAREAIDTLVIERAAFGGQAAGTEKLDNMPGFPEGIAGIDFSKRLQQQAERFGVELLQAQEVSGIWRNENYLRVKTTDGRKYSASAVIIATGSRYKRLNVQGENDFLGAGVHFCATCDGPFYKGKHVAVIGGGNSAAEESLLLTKFASKVTILVRGGQFKATQIIQESVLGNPNIEVRWFTEVKAFLGKDSKLTAILIENNQTGRRRELAVEGAFIFIGLKPNTEFLRGSGVALDRWGFIVTGHDLVHSGNRPAGYEKRDPYLLETSVPGIFAAGDVRDKSTKQVSSATGEGTTAALMVREFLKFRTFKCVVKPYNDGAE